MVKCKLRIALIESSQFPISVFVCTTRRKNQCDCVCRFEWTNPPFRLLEHTRDFKTGRFDTMAGFLRPSGRSTFAPALTVGTASGLMSIEVSQSVSHCVAISPSASLRTIPCDETLPFLAIDKASRVACKKTSAR